METRCHHCKAQLTGGADTFGDFEQCYCCDCWFQLLDLRIELRDAIAEAKAPSQMTRLWTKAEAKEDVAVIRKAIAAFPRYAGVPA